MNGFLLLTVEIGSSLRQFCNYFVTCYGHRLWENNRAPSRVPPSPWPEHFVLWVQAAAAHCIMAKKASGLFKN